MGKIKVRKAVLEQMTSKLKPSENGLETSKNDIFNTDFAQNRQNQQITSKLQANKNIFARGDFDDYKISDEELKARYGQTADGQIYDLTDPTEKFYYDLKTKFDEADYKDEIEKSVDTNKCTLEMVVDCNGNLVHRWKKITDKELLEEKNKFSTAIETFISNNYTQSTPIVVMKHIPKILQEKADMKDYELQVTSKVLRKILLPPTNTKSHNHNIPKAILKDLPIQLSYPISIYKQKDNGHIVVLTQHIIKNKPIICAIEMNKIIGMKDKIEMKINSLRSLHGKNTENFFEALKENKEELFVDKKKMDSLRAFLQHEGVYSVTTPSKINITHNTNLSSKNIIKSLTYSGYKLQGRTRLYGMDISIENKKGSYRSGTDKDGHKWRTYMNYDYGYIRGTVGTDKDHLDCYVGPDKEAQKVYVIHQNDPVTHKYDEDKCMLCFSSAADAKNAYMKQYDRPGFYGSMTTMTIDQFKSFIFSKKGKMIHKSFDIQITDITENNKQQKLEQFNKALNAIADNKPFVIKHIPSDNSEHYENLTVRLMDFDRSKIEKAVHKVALSLDADISGASKGESFVYKSQEEIVDKYFKEFTNRTRAVYNFVISYFDLPDIRIVSKAGELKHKGKILYNPSTGLPIKESEWKKFVEELEKFLNRNYTGIGEKIVLSSESLGIILDRLSKTNSFDAIKKMSVSDLKAKRYDIDWIGDSIKNMKDKFGDVISRERQARIQIACDSAAQRVTRVKDDMRNNIQQIIIDGIRDKQNKSVVAQNLFDKCASLNRDMQRIADTEVQMAANTSYCKEEVYNSEPGSKVYFKRFEMIDDNTCKQCKKLNGTIVLWSDVPLPDEHIKDPFAKYAIWEGKNEGSCPIGICHPYCRGTWVRYYPDLD